MKLLANQILRWLKEILIWTLLLAPGVLILWHGMSGVVHQKLSFRYGRMTYGDDAVGWGWLFVGLGFWGMGEMITGLKTDHPAIRIVSWMLAIGATMTGLWVLFGRALPT